MLPLVLGFAAELFSRVAIFMVHDRTAVGAAQIGLARAGGPDDAGLRRLELAVDEPSWFRSVLDTRAARCAPPEDQGDHRLAVLLGNLVPRDAFVAPIESGDRVVALLYADNLPADAPLHNTRAVERLLQEAGLALDRASRDRAEVD